jgi:hypothetical protein
MAKIDLLVHSVVWILGLFGLVSGVLLVVAGIAIRGKKI